MSLIGATILLLIGLIAWLVYEHGRRSIAEARSRKALAELTNMNRVATAGQLSASIAHEINQPLTGMMLQASAALRWLSAEKPDLKKIHNILAAIVDAGQQAGDIVAGVRAMFKKGESAKVAINLNNLINTVLALLRVDLEKDGVRVERRHDNELPAVMGDPVQLQQVILNLIVNASDAMRGVEQRRLKIETNQTAAGMVQISIEDTGPGVRDADRDRIFEPLFTTKASGMGMGLSICRSIIESHGGTITVANGVQTGTVFCLELPSVAQTTSPAELVAA
jgi:C4-dicarboxylate-specific signal transduction histidine kinase